LPDLIPRGIEGLDTIFGGGFISGGITIVQGRPGTGKTILANQMCFNHARAGGRALYVTLLAESHARMLMHLGDLGFFDASAIPDRVYYVSTFSVLETEGLGGLLTLLRREVQIYGTTMLVLDGLIAAERKAASDIEFKKFVHGLQVQATVANCLMFLMSSAGEAEAEVTVEHTMVDCVIDVRSRLYGWRSERDLEVLKRRGASYLLGRHAFSITDASVEVYPRFEMTQTRPRRTAQPSGVRLPSGLPPFDGMFGGGIPQHSMTVLEGPPGAGKTTLGLHFLAPCSAAEPGLLFTTTDSPEALLAKARAFGLPTAGLIEAGHVEVVWISSTEGLLDAALHGLMQAVRRVRPRRLCLDSLTGLLQLAPDRSRVPAVFAALVQELRILGVTSVFTSEADERSAGSSAASASGARQGDLSSVADNIVVLRLAKRRSSLLRLLSVFKARDAPIDPRVRTYRIGSNGLAIDDPPDGSEAAAPTLPSGLAAQET